MFRIREVARTWVIILMAACVVGAAPALAGPVEARCTELGSACLCSEPLRYTSAVSFYDFADPPDSEGAGAKECGVNGMALDGGDPGNEMHLVNKVDNATGVDFPAGSNPPAYVLKMTSTDADNMWWVYGTMPKAVRNETICYRGYQRFGNDLPPSVEPMRIKMSEAWIDGKQIHHDGINNGDGSYGIADSGSGHAICDGSIDMLQAGLSSWLRHEVCLDIGTNSVARRGRVTVIETGAVTTMPCGSVSVSTPADFDNYFAIGNLFLQTGGPSTYGTRYFTHAIQTRVPLNTSFWPGKATELEGGAGAPPPPPPPQEPLGKPGQPFYTP